MELSIFDYELPSELIASEALSERSASRMLVLDRKAATFTDKNFSDLVSVLGPRDVLVINNTRVFPARLYGKSDTGAAIEAFLAEDLGGSRWRVLARPGRRLKTGKMIIFSDRLTATVAYKEPDGTVVLDFQAIGDLASIVDEIGKTPLPPYIRRDNAAPGSDRERYQTVYAKYRGSIAAPTAGLHFTPEILQAVRSRGAQIAEITLHVGYGTFQPVRAEELSEHRVLPERYEIDAVTAETLQRAKDSGQRIVAVGTTTTRALESNFAAHGRFEAVRAEADLTITPGYEFRAVDALLTNFHLPQSSLLILTSTFGGHKLIMDAYRHAVDAGYRFYSYGDCMFIR